METVSSSVYHMEEVFGGPSVIVSDEYLTLIDAGLPENEDAIFACIESLGRRRDEVRHILITHGDPDHVGSLPAIAAATGAEIYAGIDEADVVEGRVPGRNGELRVGTPVDHRLRPGETIPLNGGIEVLAARGHTLGHVVYYLRQERVLFAGDSFTNIDGVTSASHDSVPQSVADLDASIQTVKTIAALNPSSVCFGHGPSLVGNGAEVLTRIAAAQP